MNTIGRGFAIAIPIVIILVAGLVVLGVLLGVFLSDNEGSHETPATAAVEGSTSVQVTANDITQLDVEEAGDSARDIKSHKALGGPLGAFHCERRMDQYERRITSKLNELSGVPLKNEPRYYHECIRNELSVIIKINTTMIYVLHSESASTTTSLILRTLRQALRAIESEFEGFSVNANPSIYMTGVLVATGGERETLSSCHSESYADVTSSEYESCAETDTVSADEADDEFDDDGFDANDNDIESPPEVTTTTAGTATTGGCVPGLTTYAEHLTWKLMHYWSFDCGTLTDLKGGRDLQNCVNRSVVDDYRDTAGHGLGLDNGYCEAPTDVYFNGLYTVSFWAKHLEENKNYSSIVLSFGQYDLNYTVSVGFILGTTLYGEAIVAANGNFADDYEMTVWGGDSLVGGSTFTDWHHFAFVMNPDTSMEIYVDGYMTAYEDCGDNYVPEFVNRTYNFVGKENGVVPELLNDASEYGITFYTGYLDELRIYGRDLNYTEVFQLYQTAYDE